MLLNQKSFVAYIIQYFEYSYDKMAVTYILNHPVYISFYTIKSVINKNEKTSMCDQLKIRTSRDLLGRRNKVFKDM